MTSWKEFPTQFAYLQPWAEKFGVRGLTIYNKVVPVSKHASRTELAELCEAYEAIAERGNIDELIEWCHSIETGTPANDAREAVRGLLLLFERLAEYDIQQTNDSGLNCSISKHSSHATTTRLLLGASPTTKTRIRPSGKSFRPVGCFYWWIL